MATDPKKRQKKMERRAAKRKEKKHSLVRQENAGLAERLTAASKFPVLDCWISHSIEQQGMGWVVLSREFPNRQVAVVSYLVDSYCLGVKDVFAEVVGRSSYDAKYLRKMTKQMPSYNALPADARKLLEDAVAYARGLGFSPHADYNRAMHLFGDVRGTDSQASFEFGKDGKPLFIAGPSDTQERSRRIVTTLTATCGPGNFDYVAMLPGNPGPGGLPALGLEEGFLEDEDDFDDEL